MIKLQNSQYFFVKTNTKTKTLFQEQAALLTLQE